MKRITLEINLEKFQKWVKDAEMHPDEVSYYAYYQKITKGKWRAKK